MYNLILHLLHISCGIFWGGAALLLHFFFIPAIKKAGPDGGKMMQALLSTRKFPLFLTLNALVTITAGLMMIYNLSNGFEAWWFGTKTGIILSLGGTCGIIAFFIGMFLNKPSADKLAKIGASIASSGAPPTNEQLAIMNKLRGNIILGLGLIAWLVLITIVCMAISHYV